MKLIYSAIPQCMQIKEADPFNYKLRSMQEVEE